MIQLESVTKRFGDVTAIGDLTLTLPDTGIYCLLGRNGAGKTTLMRLIAGRIGATSGHITVDGEVVSPGRMPESVNFIDTGVAQFNRKVSWLIDAAADVQPEFDREFALEMANRFELDKRKRFNQLSFGMKTMLTTIITAANTGRTILFDEPTLGFDPVMREQFNTLLLKSFDTHPRLIMVSTHMIDEIAKVVERLIIIDHGHLMLEAGIDDIDEMAYTLSGSVDAVRPLLTSLNCIGETVMGSVMAAHVYDHRIEPPPGVGISNISLQDFFINLVGGVSHE